MSERPVTHEVMPLIEVLLDGTIDEAGFARLESALRDDAQARALYRSYLNLHAALPGIVSQSPRLSVQIIEPEETAPLEPHEMPQEQLMVLLLQAEEKGENLDPMRLAAARFEQETADTPTKQDWLAASDYLLRHSFTPRVVASLASAAAVMLGVLLLIVLSGGDPEPQPLATDPGLYRAPVPTPVSVVATVTEQVQAVWLTANGEGALPDQTQLAPGDRLTLTQGFAQITMRRGAKVLLQAPCTVEMTDSDNALRLHSGKLVGSCQTPRSKGFTVHAPDLDVVDLGTEFGVEADAMNGSTVLVLSGSVRAQPTEQSPRAFEPVVLKESQARRVEPETGGLAMIAASEAPVFYQEKPHPYVVTVLDAAPVAYWRFEEDGAGVIANEVDSGRGDLKVVGPARLAEEGVIGRAGRLINRSQPYAYFETAEPIEALNGLDAYTIELWYYTDERYEMARENSTASVFNLYDPYQDGDQESATEAWLLSIELGNDFWVDQPDDFVLEEPPGWRKFAVRGFPMKDLSSGERREVYTAQDYPVRRWQHLVLVKDKDGVTLYLDGEVAEEAAYTPPIIDPAAVRLGRSVLDVIQEFDPENPYSKGLYRALRGRLDEVALYDRALGAGEIARHFKLATEGGSPQAD